MIFRKLLALTLITSLFSGNVWAQTYEVTITNMTKSQSFTPTLVTAHRPESLLFTAGQPASAELEILAEEGNVAPLTDVLNANSNVIDVANSEGLLAAGQSTTVVVAARGARRLSLASMLIPTNDTFTALNNIEGPKRGETTVIFARAYDSGTEVNDELCASIPGPNFAECGGPGSGGAPSGGEEGFVHIANGIQGVGDLQESTRDWRDAVARIEITRIGRNQ